MWNYNKTSGRQSGFTLVELAIVLVIIGLILAAVLKGQEMITNAKVKNLVNDMKSVSVAYYAYQDRYKAIPGDDNAASSHFTGAKNGNGDGALTGLFGTSGTALASDVAGAAGTAETEKFWQHTRMAGFMTGIATATAASPPANSMGGLLGIQSQVSAAGGSTYGMSGPVVCAGSVPWKIAQAVDTLIDDGDSDTGNVRAGVSGAANLVTAAGLSVAYGPNVAATAVIEEGMHTLCMKI